jgi:hypothetical protein
VLHAASSGSQVDISAQPIAVSPDAYPRCRRHHGARQTEER